MFKIMPFSNAKRRRLYHLKKYGMNVSGTSASEAEAQAETDTTTHTNENDAMPIMDTDMTDGVTVGVGADAIDFGDLPGDNTEIDENGCVLTIVVFLFLPIFHLCISNFCALFAVVRA